ncbi:unnamed protein product [Allacma fusca]|uniref:DDE-1 domain-containing protein n=1 Tax=Allacma fusca TaxID=39272 RepID=A0A8J2JRK9_9HEXA|nr:unnamed protein product [Allacma fusca]
MICSFSASGQYVPPMYIFPQGIDLRNVPNKPQGAVLHHSKRGWSDSDAFMKWLKLFHATVQPSEIKPILLMIDNHGSHISYEAVRYCRSSFIHILTLPPHTTHKLQPLDVAFFSPLKGYYGRAMTEWTSKNPFRKVRIEDIPTIIKPSYEKAAKKETAENDFEKTGIWLKSTGRPNRYVFSDEDFTNPDDRQDENDQPRRPHSTDSDNDPPNNLENSHNNSDSHFEHDGETNPESGTRVLRITSMKMKTNIIQQKKKTFTEIMKRIAMNTSQHILKKKIIRVTMIVSTDLELVEAVNDNSLIVDVLLVPETSDRDKTISVVVGTDLTIENEEPVPHCSYNAQPSFSASFATNAISPWDLEKRMSISPEKMQKRKPRKPGQSEILTSDEFTSQLKQKSKKRQKSEEDSAYDPRETRSSTKLMKRSSSKSSSSKEHSSI